MVFSDDEVEAAVQSVTNYHFEDNQDELISFSVLRSKWSKSEDYVKNYIFLHGITDSGSERVCKKVVAWKVEFSYEQPVFLVLSKERIWIKLQKPRKSFEDTIRTILITIHCLHFVKKHPDKSESFVWSHLQKALGFYKVKPSDNDLLDQLSLIKAAVKQDETFSKSVFMLRIVNRGKRKMLDKDVHHDVAVKKPKSVTENDKNSNKRTETTTGNETVQVWELCDDVCAICDNGGDLLCCEGRCLRSFHATVDTGFVSGCKSLGLSRDEVKATKNFFCMNCQYKQHQCFACGKLGSSDRSNNPEVYRCASATCGHFYHPRCVANLLHPINEPAAQQVQRHIIAGGSFTCTVHKCFVCKQEENKDVKELQFAICRRCPKSYHRQCVPREISFESLLDEGILQRAWESLLPDRILIFCMKHKIDPSTLTPERGHIIFPDVQNRKSICPPDSRPSQGKIATNKIKVISRNQSNRDVVNQPRHVVKMPCAINNYKRRLVNQGKTVTKKINEDPRNQSESDAHKLKQAVKMPYVIKDYNSTKIHAKQASRKTFNSKKNSPTVDASRLNVKDSVKCSSTEVDTSFALDERDAPLKEESLKKMLNTISESLKSKQEDVSCAKSGKAMRHVSCTKKSSSTSPIVEAETEMRKVDMIKDKSSPETMEIVTEIHKEAIPQAYSANSIVDKVLPQGKVDGSAKAAEVSVQTLECYNFDEPEANYNPGIFNNQTKSKIADKLLCYALNGDTIISFCCHDDDFSCLLRQKLEEAGKNCSIKNYDMFQSVVDFDIKNEDWIPTTSRLIMGLIFPFGVGASVDKFIDKVLEFKPPKLILLVCPRETKRLSDSRYDLIWEWDEFFPNKTSESPLLYIWSRQYWTNKYKSIGLTQCHISSEPEVENIEDKTNLFLDVTNHINTLPEEKCEVENLKAQGEIVFEEPTTFFSLQFVYGPLCSFSNGSCGWLDE